MKSQSLPMSMVAIIIIVLVATVAFISFFISYTHTATNQTHEEGNFAKCQALCADIASKSSTPGDVESNAGAFCNLNCDNYLRCNPNGLCSSGISCSGGTPHCS